MDKSKKYFLNSLKKCSEKGQSLVEYVLLLLVMITIGYSIFSGEKFKKFLGPNSDLFAKMRNYMEYTYRHGMTSKGSRDESDYGSGHDTYIKNGATRFFSPDRKYP